jgi:uncharacterized NAD(P)/FAD-binding protein YdhS
MEAAKQGAPKTIETTGRSARETESYEITEFIREMMEDAEGKWMYWVDVRDALEKESYIPQRPEGANAVENWTNNERRKIERRLKDPCLIFDKSKEVPSRSIIRVNSILGSI